MPHPPTPSPAERGSAGNNSLEDESLVWANPFWEILSSLPQSHRGIPHFTPLPMGEGTGEGLVGWLFGFVVLGFTPPSTFYIYPS